MTDNALCPNACIVDTKISNHLYFAKYRVVDWLQWNDVQINQKLAFKGYIDFQLLVFLHLLFASLLQIHIQGLFHKWGRGSLWPQCTWSLYMNKDDEKGSLCYWFIVRRSQPQLWYRTFVRTRTTFPTSYYTSTMFTTLYYIYVILCFLSSIFAIVSESIYIYWFTFTKPTFPNGTINLNLYMLDPWQLYLPCLSPFIFMYINTQQLHCLISHGSFTIKKA